MRFPSRSGRTCLFASSAKPSIDVFSYFTEADVSDRLTMRQAIDALEQAFHALATGKADNVPRVRAKASGIVLHSMSAAAEYLGLVGWKQYTTTRHGARFLAAMYDQESGSLVALIEANRLGQLRTGAASGLAARYLAHRDINRVGLIGTGWQAESQLEAMATEFQLQQVAVFGRDQQRRFEFARRMSEQLQIEVIPVDSAEAAVRDQPIVVTATNSREPVLAAEWISPGALVCAVGSNWLHKAELDAESVARADLVVCDSVAACRNEAGDFTAALKQNTFEWSRAVDLCQVVHHEGTGRTRDDQLIIFKSVGLAIEDVAVAALLLDRASLTRQP